MNTDWNKENKVNQAERSVLGSIDKLEHAMESLTDKVEGSSQKIQHVVDLGVRQKNELLRLKATAEDTIGPIIRSIKADPRPFLFGAAVVVAGLLWMSFRSRGAIQWPEQGEEQENWAA